MSPETKKDLEKELDGQELRYRLLADNVTDVIWMLDMDYLAYAYVSPSIEQLTGYTPQELLRQTLKDTLEPQSYQRVLEKLRQSHQRYLQGEDPREVIELQLKRKDGSTVWVETASRFYRDRDGKVYIIGITRDISDRRQWDDEREELIKRLEEAVAERDRLLRENKILMGLLPICAVCKRIRDENGQWHDLETYFSERTGAEFTHTICPICAEDAFPGLGSHPDSD